MNDIRPRTLLSRMFTPHPRPGHAHFSLHSSVWGNTAALIRGVPFPRKMLQAPAFPVASGNPCPAPHTGWLSGVFAVPEKEPTPRECAELRMPRAGCSGGWGHGRELSEGCLHHPPHCPSGLDHTGLGVVPGVPHQSSRTPDGFPWGHSAPEGALV